MKVAINAGYGLFIVPRCWVEEAGLTYQEVRGDRGRTHPLVIQAIEQGEFPVKDAVIVEFPDEATDWGIFEYDGYEWVVYVLDGKMHDVYPDGGRW